MKKLLLSLFVFAFAWTNAQVTYTVNVPAGTNECYIAGEMNDWTHQEMTKVNATQFPSLLLLQQLPISINIAVVLRGHS